MKTPSLLAGLLVAGALSAQDQPIAPASAGPDVVKEQFISPPEPGRFKDFFLPFQTEVVALSPDGRYIAYSLRDGANLSVVVVEADHPDKVTARVRVGTDDSSTAMMADNQAEPTPARVRWMRWVSPTRVAIETNRVSTEGSIAGWSSTTGAVFAFDADGSNAKLVVQPQDIPIPGGLAGGGDFSQQRPSIGASIPNTWQANEPLETVPLPPGMIEEQAPVAANVPFLAAPLDLTAPAEVSAEFSGARAIQAFDLDALIPGNFTLVTTSNNAGNSDRLDFFSVDPVTGKLTRRHADFVLPTRTSLLDRQGRIRMTLPKSHLTSFPFRYAYRGPTGAGRDRPLNEFTQAGDFSVAPENFFGTRAIPLGFDENPEILYYATNAGRDTYGIYSVNLSTGQRGSVTLENPNYDLVDAPGSAFSLNRNLVFDPHDRQLAGVRYDNALRSTAWVRPELNGLQTYLEKAFPGRSVEIIDWDKSRRRFLVATEGPADAGGFYFVDSEALRITEFARRAPWIDAKHTHPTLSFTYTAADGARLSGLVTVPNLPHLKPIPMVLLCPTAPWERVSSNFSTEVQALTDMGFAVVQLNGRGAWGLGTKQREAITAGYDLVQVEDIASSIAHLEKFFNVNPKRVALMGFGHGGFIALRTVQDHPDKFRCAIALDAPVDLANWLGLQEWDSPNAQTTLMKAWYGDAARLKANPLASHPEAIRRPVLLLNYPGREGQQRTPTFLAALRLAKAVENNGAPAQFGQLSTDYMRGLPGARAAVFGQIEEFLNLNVYDFKVKMPEMKMVQN